MENKIKKVPISCLQRNIRDKNDIFVIKISFLVPGFDIL